MALKYRLLLANCKQRQVRGILSRVNRSLVVTVIAGQVLPPHAGDHSCCLLLDGVDEMKVLLMDCAGRIEKSLSGHLHEARSIPIT